MSEGSAPHGPVSSSRTPRTLNTKTSAWTGPAAPQGAASATGSALAPSRGLHVLGLHAHVVRVPRVLLHDRDQLLHRAAHAQPAVAQHVEAVPATPALTHLTSLSLPRWNTAPPFLVGSLVTEASTTSKPRITIEFCVP